MLFSGNPYFSRWIVSLFLRSGGRLSCCLEGDASGIWHKDDDRGRSGFTFQFSETCRFESDSAFDRSRANRRSPPGEVLCCRGWSAIIVPHPSGQAGISVASESRAHRRKRDSGGAYGQKWI